MVYGTSAARRPLVVVGGTGTRSVWHGAREMALPGGSPGDATRALRTVSTGRSVSRLVGRATSSSASCRCRLDEGAEARASRAGHETCTPNFDGRTRRISKSRRTVHDTSRIRQPR